MDKTITLHYVDKRRESVLFIIKDLSMDVTLMPIVATLQAYVQSAKEKHEGWCSQRNAISDFSVTLDLVMPAQTSNDVIVFIQKLVPNVREVMGDAIFKKISHSSYDCIFSLSEENAREIGLLNKRHLAQSYGIICGADSKSLPNVDNLLTEYQLVNRILVDMLCIDASSVVEGVCSFINRDLSPYYELNELINYAYSFAGYIGPANFVSYLMCALGKPVLEINTDLALTKWDNKNYRLLTDDSHEAVLKGVKRCFPQLLA